MSFDAHKNFSYGTVLTAPSPATTGTTLVLNSGEGADFPQPSTDGEYNVTIWPTGVQPLSSNAEIVRVTARTTDTLTITRQQEGTSARTVVVGDQVALTITAKVATDIEAAGVSSQVKNETPGGLINGSNVNFTTASDYQTGSLRVYLNGQRLTGGGADYTEVSSGFTMITAPITGDVLLVDYDTNTTAFATGSTSFVYNELVNETPNGVIVVFTVDNAYVAGTTQVFRDGQLMRPGGEDYTETTPASGIITFVTAPTTGSIILVTYQQSLSVAGNADTLDGFHANATPTANQIPVLDGSAQLPVANIANTAKASAYMGSNQLNLTSGSATKVVFDTENYDPGSNYDPTTNYRFTAPVDGFYLVDARITWLGSSLVVDKRYTMFIYKNGASVAWTFNHASLVTAISSQITEILELSAGNYIEIYARQDSGVDTVDIDGGSAQLSTFDVHLLSV